MAVYLYKMAATMVQPMCNIGSAILHFCVSHIRTKCSNVTNFQIYL